MVSTNSDKEKRKGTLRLILYVLFFGAVFQLWIPDRPPLLGRLGLHGLIWDSVDWLLSGLIYLLVIVAFFTVLGLLATGVERVLHLNDRHSRK